MRQPGARGMVLVMVLVLLAVMAVAAAFALRLSLTAESVGYHQRVQAQALQAAELALRWCESQIGAAEPRVPIQPAPDVDADAPSRWSDIRSWIGTPALASAVPTALLEPALAAAEAAPQCLIEEMVLRRARGGDDRLGAWLVTARGRSADHGAGGQGVEVWLQSMVRR